MSAVEREREQLVQQAMQAQKQIFMAMQAAAGPTWLQLELTMAQLKGLVLLAHDGPMTIGEMAGALGIGRPAASVLVDRLVELALVERAEDPVDRRRTFARLSPRGEELVAQLRQGGRDRMREYLSQLSDDDLAALVRGLHALAAAIAANCARSETDAGRRGRCE